MSTVRSHVFCNRNGLLVTHVQVPVEYYLECNFSGHCRMYFPDGNRYEESEGRSSRDDLCFLFLSGTTGDMGLLSMGYTLAESIVEEEGILRKTFKNKGSEVILVLRNYLPIYLEYHNSFKQILGKIYLSDYQPAGSLFFPHRKTEISYISKKDSVVIRTLYSNVAVDADDPLKDYKFPSR